MFRSTSFILLLLLISGHDCTDVTLLGNISNSKWCTDVMNPIMDYLLGSGFLRSAILNESITVEKLKTMGIRISNLQVSGVERLERHGSLYAIVRPGQLLIVQGAIRAVEVAISFQAKLPIFSPDEIRVVTRGAVVRFGFQVRLQTGQRAALMSLAVADLGNVEVRSTGRLSSIIRKTLGNRMTRSRIASAIGSMLRIIIADRLQQHPLL